MDLYDKDGNKIEEVISREDHEKELQEAARKAVEDAQNSGTVIPKETLDKKEQELASLKADLEKLQKKDMNFETVKAGEKRLIEKIESLENDIKKSKDDTLAVVNAKETDQKIKQLADDDTELEKKIKFHFQRIVRPEDIDEERDKKLADAYTLAKGSRPTPALLNGIISFTGNDPEHKVNDNKEAIKPELVPLAKNLGLSDKDLEKYGRK